MITIGSLYAMAPRALDRPMHSHSAMELHFWLHTAGLIVYILAMWAAGVTEGWMWRATNPDGSLTYSFLASLIAVQPYYVIRTLGGLLVLSGMVVMAWNLWHTAGAARLNQIKPILVPIPEVIPEPVPHQVPAPLPARA
jgi:cytochrome c oxidase cbb3-type subunit 1